jgi:hypothetical protein
MGAGHALGPGWDLPDGLDLVDDPYMIISGAR